MCPVPKSHSHPGALELSLGLLLLHFHHLNVERMDRRLTISAFCKPCSVILAHFFYSFLPLLHVRSTEHSSLSGFSFLHSAKLTALMDVRQGDLFLVLPQWGALHCYNFIPFPCSIFSTGVSLPACAIDFSQPFQGGLEKRG